MVFSGKPLKKFGNILLPARMLQLCGNRYVEEHCLLMLQMCDLKHRYTKVASGTARAVLGWIPAVIPGSTAHIVLSGCTAMLQETIGRKEERTRKLRADKSWRGIPPKSYAWLIQLMRHKLNIWSASDYLLVEKVFLSIFCFIFFLFIFSHDYWFSNTSHCNFLHKMIDKEMARSLYPLSFCYTILNNTLITFWRV